ncbi:MAG TPA: TonB-dependent receptor [Methylophilus sp.]|nr:TonB-dependent receptor [Methylophilus sp.]
MQNNTIRNAILAVVISLLLPTASFAELNTQVPKEQEDGFSVPLNLDMPAQPLAAALRQFSIQANLSLTVDSALIVDKKSPSVKGRMTRKEAIQRMLDGTGLQGKIEGDKIFIQRAAKEDKSVQLDKVEVRAKRFYEVGPLPGLGLTKEQIPGNVQTLTAQDIKEAHALSLTDLMNSRLQSVNVNDYQGNPFQMDVQYRGFTAGPQIGTPQGLSAFIDGIRINEPFGDVVNWDMIPLNALASFDVFPGSNPIFGLGTLGGALSMKTKDGFNHSGFNADVMTGSFARKQLQVDGGWNNGTVGLFAAGNFFLEDGWRENSPSRVNQLFTKASYRGEKLDINLGVLNVWNDLVGNGMVPTEMYAQDRNGVYTSPDTTKNKLLQFQLSGSYFVNDTFSVSAQAYRRKSNRNQFGADVYTQYGNQTVKRSLRPGEQFTCLFDSTNGLGLPDYHVLDMTTDLNDPFANQDFLDYISGTPPAGSFNRAIPAEAAEFLAGAQNNFNSVFQNYREQLIFRAQNGASAIIASGEVTSFSNGEPSWGYDTSVLQQFRTVVGDPVTQAFLSLQNFYYYTADGVKHMVVPVVPNNAADCAAYKSGPDGTDATGLAPLEVPYGTTGERTYVDGAAQSGGTGPGVVEGTPTSVLTNTQIDQITDGASVQLNWNFEKHKLMVGASIDMPSADYTSSQMLGLLDANRKAYLAPNEIRDQYALADQSISNNNFKGSQVTKSLYFSETWSPIETLHFTGSARYNTTKGQNKIASRTFGFTVFDLSDFEAFPDEYGVCINGNCPTAGYIVPDASNVLNTPEKEKFSYQSLNPSLGVSWQAKESLNFYANISQGTRVPSVIELGCAFDPTPIPIGSGKFLARSLAQNRSCSLPTTLSGDPYLPQIKATSMDIGLRGRWGDNIEWNLGAYRTDLRDDIYLVTYPGNRSFFNTIGDTRREGIEAGMTATLDKWKLRLNYALTSATFENSFKMAANDNSSSVETVTGNNDFGREIQVNPGDRMPGVPLHNLNATVSYAVTPKWQVGFTAVAHSMAYVRGNENNKHQTGVTLVDSYEEPATGTVIPVSRAPTTSPGLIPGYMTFNFQTSYKLNSEWTLGLRVNNIFDKEYFSAGRLGRNPFSPSVYGAIGPDGYNHNSSDWQTTNFIAPGAPRGAWVSLTYQFDPNK